MAQYDTDYLTSVQAAETISLSKSYLEKLRVRGGGPPYIKISPRRVLYQQKELIAWLEGHRVNSTSEVPGYVQGRKAIGGAVQ